MGVEVGMPRPPYHHLTNEDREALKRAMKSLNLI